MVTPLDSQAASASAPEEAGRYFRYMAQFVGFTDDDAKAIRQSALVVEKHLPEVIGRFYTNLLQYPPTRKIFLKKDGSVDEDYLQLRMLHQANFWRRSAGGVYDDDYARFVDYVGRAHTSRGADPHIYIAERYVIGMVGFVQHAIIDAIIKELNGYDDDLEMRAIKAWNKLCMVLLEMLARAYGEERLGETLGEQISVNPDTIFQMSVESYEKGLGLHRPLKYTDVRVARLDEIPEGDRKIVEHNGISIGVFHHKDNWYALRNSCLHRGGPVATGKLAGDHLFCPWHGYTYDVTDGKLLIDPSAHLEMYAVSVQDGNVYLRFPEVAEAVETSDANLAEAVTKPEAVSGKPELKENEFFVNQLKPGDVKLLILNGRRVAVYNVAGAFYATQENCTHAGGPLSEGELDGKVITCPWHGSCFDVTDGTVVCRPATEKLQTFSVSIQGEIGRVEVKA